MRLIKPNVSKIILHINEASLKKCYGLFFLCSFLCYFTVIALIYHLHWVEENTGGNPIAVFLALLYILCISGSKILFSVPQILCACVNAHTQVLKFQSSVMFQFLSVSSNEMANELFRIHLHYGH